MSERFTLTLLKFLKPLDLRSKNWMYILVQSKRGKGSFLFTLFTHCFRDEKMAALPPSVILSRSFRANHYCLFKPLSISKIFKAENFKTVPAVRKISV